MRAGATSLPRVAIGRAQAKGAGGATQGRAGQGAGRCREERPGPGTEVWGPGVASEGRAGWGAEHSLLQGACAQWVPSWGGAGIPGTHGGPPAATSAWQDLGSPPRQVRGGQPVFAAKSTPGHPPRPSLRPPPSSSKRGWRRAVHPTGESQRKERQRPETPPRRAQKPLTGRSHSAAAGPPLPGPPRPGWSQGPKSRGALRQGALGPGWEERAPATGGRRESRRPATARPATPAPATGERRHHGLPR